MLLVIGKKIKLVYNIIEKNDRIKWLFICLNLIIDNISYRKEKEEKKLEHYYKEIQSII